MAKNVPMMNAPISRARHGIGGVVYGGSWFDGSDTGAS